MGILSWIIIGGFAGWVASLIMKTDKKMGLLANIIVGIIGAVIGGFLMSLINRAGVTGFNLYSFGVAVLGSVVFLFVIKLIRGK